MRVLGYVASAGGLRSLSHCGFTAVFSWPGTSLLLPQNIPLYALADLFTHASADGLWLFPRLDCCERWGHGRLCTRFSGHTLSGMLQSLRYILRSGFAGSNDTCVYSSWEQQTVTPRGPPAATAAARETSHCSTALPTASFHPKFKKHQAVAPWAFSCISWEANGTEHLFSCVYGSLTHILWGKMSIQARTQLSFCC